MGRLNVRAILERDIPETVTVEFDDGSVELRMPRGVEANEIMSDFVDFDPKATAQAVSLATKWLARLYVDGGGTVLTEDDAADVLRSVAGHGAVLVAIDGMFREGEDDNEEEPFPEAT